MNMDVDDNAVERTYLDEVEHAVRARDAASAKQIRAEIAAHIAEARADAEQRGEDISIKDIIAEIGDPLAVAAEVPPRETTGARPSTIPWFDRWQPMTYVWVVCLMIAVVSNLYFIGWALGLVMMWTSPYWTRRVKIWATALLPALFLLAFAWFDFIFVASYAGPVALAVLLYFTSAPIGERMASKRGARKPPSSDPGGR